MERAVHISCLLSHQSKATDKSSGSQSQLPLFQELSQTLRAIKQHTLTWIGMFVTFESSLNQLSLLFRRNLGHKSHKQPDNFICKQHILQETCKPAIALVFCKLCLIFETSYTLHPLCNATSKVDRDRGRGVGQRERFVEDTFKQLP